MARPWCHAGLRAGACHSPIRFTTRRRRRAIFQPLLRSPVGKVARVKQTAVSDFSFRNQRVELSAGSGFRWRFLGTERHDVTLANGPEGLASASVREGSFSFRFRRKGTYNLYCSLHPTLMTQRVVVR